MAPIQTEALISQQDVCTTRNFPLERLPRVRPASWGSSFCALPFLRIRVRIYTPNGLNVIVQNIEGLKPVPNRNRHFRGTCIVNNFIQALTDIRYASVSTEQ